MPVTRLPDRELRPYEALIGSPECGIERPSRLVANQVRTISKTRITEILGRVSADEAAALDRALAIQLGLGGFF